MRLLLTIDRISGHIGRAAAWLLVVLTGLITWEMGSRYAFDSPHAWSFDAQLMAYGTLFMLAGAYTLATSGHVRGDVLYGFLPPRGQAAIDLVLYLGFFVPGVVALVWAGYEFAGDSWAIREQSSIMVDGPPIYPFKTVIPVAGAVLLLQGFAEIARCVMCLRDGAWPPRAPDVSEIDVEALTEEAHHGRDARDDDVDAMRRREGGGR